jgi:hypothetical protein
VARCRFIYDGKEFEYGSLQEQIAMMEYSRTMTTGYLAAVAPLVGAESASKLIRSIRTVMFPDERMNDIAYLKKSKELFEKLRNVNLMSMPMGKNKSHVVNMSI